MNRGQYKEFAFGALLHSPQFLSPRDLPGNYLHLLASIASANKQASMKPNTIAMGFDGMVLHRSTEHGRKIIGYLVNQLNKLRNADIPDQNIASLVRAISICEVPVPEWLQKKYDDFLGAYKPKPTYIERKAFEYLSRELYPFLNISHNYYYDGIEMDLYAPQLKINIEIDDPIHELRRKKDQRRDSYLRGKGIRVIRVEIDSTNYKEVLDRIEF